LYGRCPAILRLNPFSKDQSREFLTRGFKECSVPISGEEVNEVIEILNGYPGWLTYYGNFRCIRGFDHQGVLERVYNEGKKVMLEELNRFLRNKKNKVKYIEILENLPARWSELGRKIKVPGKILRDMPKNLQDAMLIEKIGMTYIIPDPVLKKLVLEL